jgi:uncharacterized protein YjiK
MIKLSAFLISIGAIWSCKNTDDSITPQISNSLTQISTNDLDLPEPSGLCTFLSERFLSVSDADGMIRVIDLTGQVTETIDIQGVDLEGIAFNDSNSTIYTVDESKGNLTAYTTSGDILKEWQIIQGGNSGLEGCTVDSENGIIYMVKQRSPGQLFSFNLADETLITIELNFDEDFSGIYYNDSDELLWILSDQSKTIYLCDTSGEVIRSYTHDIDQAEGITIDNALNRIYLVSDSKSRIYVFEKPL